MKNSRLVLATAGIAALATAAALSFAGPASAAGMNGHNPTSSEMARSPGGGSGLGAAQLAGSYFADGTIIVGIGANGNAAILGTGVYQVNFRRNITACVWTGSIGFGTFSGSTAASSISVTGRAGTNNALFVQTFNLSGTPTALPFEIHIICG